MPAPLPSATPPNQYGYDNADQLTSDRQTSGSTTFAYNYVYDLAGNWTDAGYATTTKNEITNGTGYTYTYDAEGNEITKTKPGDIPDQEGFDAKGWHESDPQKDSIRLRIAKDLSKKGKLIGRSTMEVKEMFGEPMILQGPTPYEMTYYYLVNTKAYIVRQQVHLILMFRDKKVVYFCFAVSDS